MILPLYAHILLTRGFDSFRTNETSIFSEEVQTVKDTSKMLYSLEMRIGVYASVIAIIMIGISFAIQGDPRERAQNKIWLLRVAGIIIFIFGLGAFIVQAVHNANVLHFYQ